MTEKFFSIRPDIKLPCIYSEKTSFRNWFKLILVGITFITFLSACTTHPVVPVEHLNIALSPESLGQNISVQQQLHVAQNKQSHDLQVVLEVNKEKITLIGLAMSQRVLSLEYDGKNLTSWRHFMLPKEVQAQNVLQNLQLAFWPEEVIQKALPKDWTIREDALARNIYYKNDRMIKIKYNNPVHWLGTIVFEDCYYHYSLTIQSVSMSPEHDLSE